MIEDQLERLISAMGRLTAALEASGAKRLRLQTSLREKRGIDHYVAASPFVGSYYM